MNTVSSWVQRHKFLSTFLTLFLIWFVWYDIPFKSTDPSSPYFVESLFRLRNYPPGLGVVELRDKVLPKLFPVGTSKEYVDLMLVDRGGAHIIDQTNYNIGRYVYTYTHIKMALTPDAYNIRIFYDKNMKVEAVHFNGRWVVGEGYRPRKVSDISQTGG